MKEEDIELETFPYKEYPGEWVNKKTGFKIVIWDGRGFFMFNERLDFRFLVKDSKDWNAIFVTNTKYLKDLNGAKWVLNRLTEEQKQEFKEIILIIAKKYDDWYWFDQDGYIKERFKLLLKEVEKW
jgi:hypothetical protein